MVTDDKEAHAEKPLKDARRWSLLAAFVAGEACSICATFFTHALRPPRIYVIDRYTHRHLLHSQIGGIQEVFYWNDLIRVLALSLIIFALVWWTIRIAARLAHEHRRTTDARAEEIRVHRAALGIGI